MDNPSNSGQKAFSAAIRTFAIGGISSFLLVLLAVLTLFLGSGDSAGPGFYLFCFLGIIVLIISSFIATARSLIGMIKSVTELRQNNTPKDETFNEIVKTIGLIFGIILVLSLVFGFLNSFW